MKILIKDATLISMEETRTRKEEDYDVLVDNEKIVKIGQNLDEKADKVIDAKSRVLLPGLINTHAHVPMSIFREIVDGLPLQEWLEEKIWPIESKLTGDDIYKASLLSFEEMIASGTTTINDHYFMSENIIKAAIEKGVRIELTRTLMDSDGQGDKRLEELQDLLEKYQGKNENISFSIGIHGLYTSSPDYVKKATDLARKYNLNIHMHFCENKEEVETIKKVYGVSYPAQVLERYFEGLNVILAHCVMLTKQDMEVIKRMKINVSHCPVSNLRLGCGIAPIEELRNMGVNITLGTDGQGSGSNLDMFETMKFATLLQKGYFNNPRSMPAYEVLKMATINGAKALRKEKEIGSICVGKKADMILVDLDTCLTRPINDIFADLVYNAKAANVVMTMVGGRII